MRNQNRMSPWVAVVVVLSISAFAIVGCPSGSIFDHLDDSTAPVPGDNGTITTSNVTLTSVDLGWTAASDETTAAADLDYRVYYADSDTIDTVADAAQNGVESTAGWTTDITSWTVSGLTSNTTYWLVVVVGDEASNAAAYEPVSVATILGADSTAPVPGGALSTLSPSHDQVEVSWPGATDDRDGAGELTYALYYSDSDNLTGVLATQANGTAVDASGGSPLMVGSLTYGTPYYFNLLVSDTAGNVAEYGSVSQTTLQGPRIEFVTATAWSPSATILLYGSPDTATRTITVRNNSSADQALEITGWGVYNMEAPATQSVIFSILSSLPVEAIDPGSTYDVIVQATTQGRSHDETGTQPYELDIGCNDPTIASFKHDSDINVQYS